MHVHLIFSSLFGFAVLMMAFEECGFYFVLSGLMVRRILQTMVVQIWESIGFYKSLKAKPKIGWLVLCSLKLCSTNK